MKLAYLVAAELRIDLTRMSKEGVALAARVDAYGDELQRMADENDEQLAIIRDSMDRSRALRARIQQLRADRA